MCRSIPATGDLPGEVADLPQIFLTFDFLADFGIAVGREVNFVLQMTAAFRTLEEMTLLPVCPEILHTLIADALWPAIEGVFIIALPGIPDADYGADLVPVQVAVVISTVVAAVSNGVPDFKIGMLGCDLIEKRGQLRRIILICRQDHVG